MSSTILSLILDLSILACLGGTIFYAFRLTNALSNFRDHRKDLQGLITDLTENVDRAVQATEILKATSMNAGQDLQGTINEAKALSSELQEINEVGNNLAKRLEGLADNRAESRGARSGGAELESLFSPNDEVDSDDSFDATFAIQDRDFGDEELEDNVWGDEPDIQGDADHLQSKAEKELYAALKNKKKSAG